MKRFFAVLILVVGILGLPVWAQVESSEVRTLKSYADNGDVEAMKLLGEIYKNGNGVTKNYYKASYWLTRAAEKGNTSAQINLAFMYKTGDGAVKNPDEAIRLLRLAAEKGDSKAQLFLGSIFLEGDGVQKDPFTAADYFIRAAESGEVAAMLYLATMYRKGEAGAPDVGLAARWGGKAASMGSVAGMISLADLLERGKDIPKNLLEAYGLYKVAADRCQVATSRRHISRSRDRVWRKLRLHDRDEARRIASEMTASIPQSN